MYPQQLPKKRSSGY